MPHNLFAKHNRLSHRISDGRDRIDPDIYAFGESLLKDFRGHLRMNMKGGSWFMRLGPRARNCKLRADCPNLKPTETDIGAFRNDEASRIDGFLAAFHFYKEHYGQDEKEFEELVSSQHAVESDKIMYARAKELKKSTDKFYSELYQHRDDVVATSLRAFDQDDFTKKLAAIAADDSSVHEELVSFLSVEKSDSKGWKCTEGSSCAIKAHRYANKLVLVANYNPIAIQATVLSELRDLCFKHNQTCKGSDRPAIINELRERGRRGLMGHESTPVNLSDERWRWEHPLKKKRYEAATVTLPSEDLKKLGAAGLCVDDKTKFTVSLKADLFTVKLGPDVKMKCTCCKKIWDSKALEDLRPTLITYEEEAFTFMALNILIAMENHYISKHSRSKDEIAKLSKEIKKVDEIISLETDTEYGREGKPARSKWLNCFPKEILDRLSDDSKKATSGNIIELSDKPKYAAVIGPYVFWECKDKSKFCATASELHFSPVIGTGDSQDESMSNLFKQFNLKKEAHDQKCCSQ